MKKLIFISCFFLLNNLLHAQQGLKFEKMVTVGDSVMQCPEGHIWQVQTILNSQASLKESFGSSFMTGMGGGQSDADALMRNQQKLTQIRIGKSWFYPSSYPFFLESGDHVSSGNKDRYIVIAQYKVE